MPDYCGENGGGNLYECFFYQDDEIPIDEDECGLANSSGDSGGTGGGVDTTDFASDQEIEDALGG